MINKKKKCKGIGKAIKHNGCGKLTFYRKHGLCTDGGGSCYASFLVGSMFGKDLVNNTITKVTKPRKDLEIAKTEKKERSSLSALKKSVVDVCHLYIRTRDKGKACASCNAPYKLDFDAGHFYSAGKYSNLKFNEHNIHGQCIQCNRFKEGNLESYRVNIVNIIGSDVLLELDKLASDYKKDNFKWDRLQLIEIRNYFRKKLKELN
jgi:hypothetical protein